jgi:hypothetical protein
MSNMRKIFALPLAAIVAVGFVACDSNPAGLAPEGPNLELVDLDQRIDADDVNAHVYGSFALSFDEEGPGGIGPIKSGPANFPGNPKNAGTCDDGLWINAQGKRTSGSLERPHPHCVGETEGGTVTVWVVLEPISAINDRIGQDNENLQLAADRPDGDVRAVRGNPPPAPPPVGTEGRGIIEAYAIDAATIGSGNPKRVGVLTIDLAQYDHNSTNYFLEDCSLTVSETYFRCLNTPIVADYMPLDGDDGVGYPISLADWDEQADGAYPVTGFLYWTYSAEGLPPFNYSDMPDGEE